MVGLFGFKVNSMRRPWMRSWAACLQARRDSDASTRAAHAHLGCARATRSPPWHRRDRRAQPSTRSSLLSDPVFVSLEVDEPKLRAPIHYEGDELAVFEVRYHLKTSYGFRGEPIGDVTCGWDLAAAMKGQWMKPFQPHLLIGREILGSK
jgi:hypothetical protein